jgi:transposase
MEFRELSDAQWKFIRFHLPPQPKVGRKRANDRKTINGILFILITGCRWRDIPRCYGPYITIWKRLKWWSEEGVWDRILSALQGCAYMEGKLSLDIVSIDSTLVDSKKVVSLWSSTATKVEKALKSTPP